MGVYHITYAHELKEICLYFNGGCQFSCYGCITDWHPMDCHLEEKIMQTNNRTLDIKKFLSYLQPLTFKKVIFLGKEPTVDSDFLLLAMTLKKHFSAYNIFLTNAWEYVDSDVLDEVCLSIKAITPSIFERFTGKNNPNRVLNNFQQYVKNSCLYVRAESVFIPGYIDLNEIEKIACFIASVDENIPYRIDGYIPINAYFGWKDKFRRPTKDEMEKAKKFAQRYLRNVSILHSEVKIKYKVERIY